MSSDDDSRHRPGKDRCREPDRSAPVVQLRPAPGKRTRVEAEGSRWDGAHTPGLASRLDSSRPPREPWDADGFAEAAGMTTIDRPPEESLVETRATIDDAALSAVARGDWSDTENASPTSERRKPATIDRPAEESLVETRATIDDSSGADRRPESGWVVRARAFHREHPELVREFNRLTGGSCADGDTVDPVRVARWQLDHGVEPDGRVGTATLRAARAAGSAAAVQRKAGGKHDATTDVHATAAAGVRGAGSSLPYLDQIQASFGRHDVSHVRAHVGGDTADAANAIGAEAYATGSDVAFAAPPTIHTAAHEAAHVVQQRGGVQLKGGVGEVGDVYERHADAVADAVIAGESAEPLLDTVSGSGSSMSRVQMQATPPTGDSAVQARIATVERSLVEAERIIRDEVRGTWLPALYNAIGVRDYHGARDAGATLTAYMSNAERRIAAAREQQPRQIDDTLRQRIDDVTANVRAARVEVDAAVRLAPAVEDSSTDETTAAPVMESSVDEAEAWSSWMDAEEHLANVVAEQEANRRLIADDRSEAVGPVHPDAISGVHLVIQAPLLPKYDQILDRHLVGPGEAGPYRFQPHVRERRLLYYVAFHRERRQQEWVIAPGAIDSFVQNIDYFIATARNAYPGSKHLPDSQKDGADAIPHPPSILELEAFGQAPWQQQFGGGSLAGRAQSTDGTGSAPEFANPLLVNPMDGVTNTNGGSAIVGLHNAHVRLQEYVFEATRLAKELHAQMNEGSDHLDARSHAVNERNRMMHDVRRRVSPAAEYMSRKIKSEVSVDVETMTKKKTEDLIDTAAGDSKKAMNVVGGEGDAVALRAMLEQDSELWAEYVAKLQTGHDARLLYQDAIQQVGQREPVSRAIVTSAGKPNKMVTGFAVAGAALNAAGAVIGLYEFVTKVEGAEEGERAHVAAHEFSRFTGGIIGAELGAAGAVWFASLLVPNLSTPAIIVISIIGGAVGSGVGAELGPNLVDVWGGQLNAVGMATLGPGMAQNGGYNGLYERSMREGLKAHDIEAQLADAIFARDEELREVEESIENARDEKELRKLWSQRLALVEDRNALGNLYGALKMKIIDESEAWSLVGGDEPGER